MRIAFGLSEHMNETCMPGPLNIPQYMGKIKNVTSQYLDLSMVSKQKKENPLEVPYTDRILIRDTHAENHHLSSSSRQSS